MIFLQIIRAINKARCVYWNFFGRLYLKAHGVKFGRAVTFYGLPIVRRHPGSTIEIGDNVVLCSNSSFTALGVNHPVILRTLSDSAKIVIASDCGLSGTTICAAHQISIGHGTLVGANCTLADTDFHPVASKDRRYAPIPMGNKGDAILIDDNVFLGSGVTILKAVHIHTNSVIGAHSVVTNSVPANSLSAGVPSRVLKTFDSFPSN